MTRSEAIACSIVLKRNFPNIEHSIKEHKDSGIYYIVLLSDYISHNPAQFGDSTGRHKITATFVPFFIDILNMFVTKGTLNLHIQFKEELSRLEQSPSLLDVKKEPPE